MAVVTISRQFGAGGRTLGIQVAKKLGYQFLDYMIIEEISKKAKVTTSSVKAMERSGGTFISKFITGALSRTYMERLLGEDVGYMDEQVYINKLTEVITEFAEKDNFVILGRGGQYILKDFSNVYHFLLVATENDRAKFIQKFYNVTDKKALRAVANGDKARANMYSRLHKTNFNDPQLYHLVLNMSKISIDQALNQIHTLVQK
jgi:cytidylate kinase